MPSVKGDLPEPFGFIGPSMLRRGPPGTSQTFIGNYERGPGVDRTALFTADQMQSYARLAVQQERDIIDLLVAAGHVSAEKVASAREIAAQMRKGWTSWTPPPPSDK